MFISCCCVLHSRCLPAGATEWCLPTFFPRKVSAYPFSDPYIVNMSAWMLFGEQIYATGSKSAKNREFKCFRTMTMLIFQFICNWKNPVILQSMINSCSTLKLFADVKKLTQHIHSGSVILLSASLQAASSFWTGKTQRLFFEISWFMPSEHKSWHELAPCQFFYKTKWLEWTEICMTLQWNWPTRSKISKYTHGSIINSVTFKRVHDKTTC